MSARNLPVNYNIQSKIFDQLKIQSVFNFLKSNSQVFQSILDRIPDKYIVTGVTTKQILITDDYRDLGRTQAPNNPAVAHIEGGTLIVYLNPGKTGNIAGRDQGIAEFLAHEFEDYTIEGQKLLKAFLDSGQDNLQTIHEARGYTAEKALARELNLEYPEEQNAVNVDRPVNQKPTYIMPGKDGCFAAGTLIELPDGVKKPIENIRSGDTILSYDGSVDGGLGVLHPRVVRRVFRNVTDEWLIIRAKSEEANSLQLTVTAGHHFLNSKGIFERIDQILSGDCKIVDSNGNTLEVVADRITRDTIHHREPKKNLAIFHSNSREAGKDFLDDTVWNTFNLAIIPLKQVREPDTTSGIGDARCLRSSPSASSSIGSPMRRPASTT